MTTWNARYDSGDVETKHQPVAGHDKFTLDELSALVDMFNHPGWRLYMRWSESVQRDTGTACLSADCSPETWHRLQGTNSHICDVLNFADAATGARETLSEKRKKIVDKNKTQ